MTTTSTTEKTCYCGRALLSTPDRDVHAEGPDQCWPDDFGLYAEWDPTAPPSDRIVRDEEGRTWRSQPPNRARLGEDEVDMLARAAQIYVDAFTDDDRLTILEAMMLTEVKTILEKLGMKQEWEDHG